MLGELRAWSGSYSSAGDWPFLMPAACDKPASSIGPPPPPLARELTFYGWAGDVPQSVLDAFTAESSIRNRRPSGRWPQFLFCSALALALRALRRHRFHPGAERGARIRYIQAALVNGGVFHHPLHVGPGFAVGNGFHPNVGRHDRAGG